MGRWVDMRWLLVCIAVPWLAPCAARADGVAEDGVAVPMTGPFRAIGEACASLVAARSMAGSAEEEQRWRWRVSCRAVEYRRAPDGGAVHAVLARDSELRYHRVVSERWRAYAIAIRRADGWWLSPQSEIDLDGNAYLAGNCCSGSGGRPRYALGFVRATGFSHPALCQ